MSFTRGVRDVVSTKSLVQTITFRQPTFHKKRVRVGHLSNDGKRLFRRLHFFWGKMFHRQFFLFVLFRYLNNARLKSLLHLKQNIFQKFMKTLGTSS